MDDPKASSGEGERDDDKEEKKDDLEKDTGNVCIVLKKYNFHIINNGYFE